MMPFSLTTFDKLNSRTNTCRQTKSSEAKSQFLETQFHFSSYVEPNFNYMVYSYLCPNIDLLYQYFSQFTNMF